MKQDILNKSFIRYDESIKFTMKKMDEVRLKILLVTDESNTLVGTVSDGDIRRWILAEKGLNEQLHNAMNKDPIVVGRDYSRENVMRIMKERRIEWVPVVDARRKVVDLILWSDFFESDYADHVCRKINLPVVIMAGGKGSRLEPFTKVFPKPLIPIGDKPIIEHIIERHEKYGAKDFYVTVNYKADLIKAYFSGNGMSYALNFVHEDKALGTAGSLNLLRGSVLSTFFVSNCDVLVDTDYAEIYDFHRANSNALTIVASMQYYPIPYGVLEIVDGGGLRNIQEKPELDFLVNTGMYVCEPEILDEIPSGEYCDINTLINKLSSKGFKVGVYPVSKDSWLDIGQWDEYKKTVHKLTNI